MLLTKRYRFPVCDVLCLALPLPGRVRWHSYRRCIAPECKCIVAVLQQVQLFKENCGSRLLTVTIVHDHNAFIDFAKSDVKLALGLTNLPTEKLMIVNVLNLKSEPDSILFLETN
jgi:hypothetical protein